MLIEDYIIEATSPEGHDIALAVWAEGAEGDYCVAALVDRTTGEVREQTINRARLSSRWQATAARKMMAMPVNNQTPLVLLPSARG